jgi:hypothetical protein
MENNMKYIRVINNIPIGNPSELPISWENVTNFYLLSDQQLKEYGWYPFEIEYPNIGENEIISSTTVIFENDKVIRRSTKRQLTQDEIDKRNQLKSNKEWEEIRKKRNQLLSDCDWTQLIDAQVDNKTQWQAYRQNLRDLTKAPNPEDVIWPVKPNVILPPPPPPGPEPEPPPPPEDEPSVDENGDPLDSPDNPV